MDETVDPGAGKATQRPRRQTTVRDTFRWSWPWA